MELLLLLITAHFIGDFYLQPTTWVTCRNTKHVKSNGLWKHIGVHTFLNFLVFLICNVSWGLAFVWLVVISFLHLMADIWKSYKDDKLSYLIIDQCIHILVIVMAWIHISYFTLAQLTTFITTHFSAKTVIIFMAYLLVCKPASVVISLALKKHTDSLKNNVEMNKTMNKEIGLISAGAWIGYIERCLAISFIFMGQFAGIGFLVATKTIFRFGDLTNSKDMKLTEYMMLGTLFSYAIAIFVGWSALKIYLMM
jgi:hypothetical protein